MIYPTSAGKLPGSIAVRNATSPAHENEIFFDSDSKMDRLRTSRNEAKTHRELTFCDDWRLQPGHRSFVSRNRSGRTTPPVPDRPLEVYELKPVSS